MQRGEAESRAGGRKALRTGEIGAAEKVRKHKAWEWRKGRGDGFAWERSERPIFKASES